MSLIWVGEAFVLVDVTADVLDGAVADRKFDLAASVKSGPRRSAHHVDERFDGPFASRAIRLRVERLLSSWLVHL